MSCQEAGLRDRMRRYSGRGRDRFGGERPGSLEVGEELTLRIFGVSRRGDGMGKAKGYTIFVPHTKAGDVVKVRVTRVWSRYATAEVVSTEASAGEG